MSLQSYQHRGHVQSHTYEVSWNCIWRRVPWKGYSCCLGSNDVSFSSYNQSLKVSVILGTWHALPLQAATGKGMIALFVAHIRGLILHRFGSDPYLNGEGAYETILGIQSNGVQGTDFSHTKPKRKSGSNNVQHAPNITSTTSRSMHEKLAPPSLMTGM